MVKAVNGTWIGFEEDGDGEHCLFLHGNRDCKNVFYGLRRLLQSNFHLLFMDYRGHGESKVSMAGFTYDQFVLDIEELLNQQQVNKVNLVGHSIGGVLSLLYYFRYPEKVNKIVLLGTSSYFQPKFQRPEKGRVITDETIHKTNEAAKPFFFLPEYPEVTAEILNNWKCLSPVTHENMIKMGHVDIRDKLQDIKCRVLLINGEKDKICTFQEGQFMHEKITNSRLKIVADTGHYMFMEKPREVAGLIQSFLRDDFK